MTLTEFVLSRIAEDEVAAQVAAIEAQSLEPWPWSARRVLAECEAKRRTIELLVQQPDHEDPLSYASVAIRMLAVPYADHSDYRPEWVI